MTTTSDLRPAVAPEPLPPPGRRPSGRLARHWRWLRPLVGAGVLAALVARFGTGPFRSGLAGVTPGLVLTALLTTAVSTLCCAWRWRLVAGRLGLVLSPAGSVAAYYRSQLLNATLPGGVVGDVHRAVRHGAEAGGLGLGLRSVGWDRVLGQLVQVGLLLTALAVVPSPLQPTVLTTAGLAAGAVAVGAAPAVLVGRRSGRFGRAAAADFRRVLGRPRTAAAVVLLSVAAATCHVVLFVLAARAAGASLPLHVAVVVALVVLVVSAVPTSVAGWGPREGAAAWAFGAAGASAAAGVGAAAAYGVLALAGTLPGLLLLVGPRRRGGGGRDG